MAKKTHSITPAQEQPAGTKKVCGKCGRITTFASIEWNRPDGSIRYVMVCTRCYSTTSLITD